MVLLGLLAPSWGCAAAAPLPERVQSLTGGADSHAFLAAAHQSVPYDLAAQGYIEEEFLVAGTAGVYDWPRDLRQRYGSGEHYLRLVRDSAHRLQRQGWLTAEDARELINQARGIAPALRSPQP